MIAFMNIGGQELILILLIVLVLFGAKKLPELARGMGQAQHDFLQLAIAGPTGRLAMDQLGTTGSVRPPGASCSSPTGWAFPSCISQSW